MTISTTTRLRQNPEHHKTHLDNEVVIMHGESGHYFNLDETGSFIWGCLEQPQTVAELCQQIQQHYHVDAEQCYQDIVPYLHHLVSLDLLQHDT
jgi:hypothetical protein